TERAVADDLKEAEGHQNEGHWPEARQDLERAAGRLAPYRPGPLLGRVRAMQRNVNTVARLEEARAWTSAVADDRKPDYAAADQDYADAFAAHGLDLAVLPSEDAAREIGRSAICTQLVGALDTWAFVKDQARAGAGDRLRGIARLADDDQWRQQLRDPRVLRDPDALEELASPHRTPPQPLADLSLLPPPLAPLRK